MESSMPEMTKGTTPHHQFLNLYRLLNGHTTNRCHKNSQEDPISSKRKKQRNHQLRVSRTDFSSSATKTPKWQTGLQSEIKNSPNEAFSRSLGYARWGKPISDSRKPGLFSRTPERESIWEETANPSPTLLLPLVFSPGDPRWGSQEIARETLKGFETLARSGWRRSGVPILSGRLGHELHRQILRFGYPPHPSLYLCASSHVARSRAPRGWLMADCQSLNNERTT